MQPIIDWLWQNPVAVSSTAFAVHLIGACITSLKTGKRNGDCTLTAALWPIALPYLAARRWWRKRQWVRGVRKAIAACAAELASDHDPNHVCGDGDSTGPHKAPWPVADHIVDANKMVAAGYYASGSAPDEAKRPVTKGEHEKAVESVFIAMGGVNTRLAALEAATKAELDARLKPITDWMAHEAASEFHKNSVAALDARLAALEAAQKPAPELWEPNRTKPIVGDVVYWAGRYATVERIDDEVRLDSGVSLHEWAFYNVSMTETEMPRIVKRAAQKPKPPESYPTGPKGVLIDGHWWRAFRCPARCFRYLCCNGTEAAYTGISTSWGKSTNPWTVQQFDAYRYPELPESSVRAMHAEAKKQGVV